jgi:methylated-DNA-[protein]-cysteine S-methyltransferase
VATERGIAAVGLGDGARTLRETSRRLGGQLVEDGADTLPRVRDHLRRARERLGRAFTGEERGLSEIPVDLAGLSDWDRRVLTATRTVPRGCVTSYGRIARLAGSPGAARAAGGALGRNPVWILVPCHRVIAGDGTLGGYGGGLASLDVKRALLAGEGIELPAHELFGLGAAARRSEARSSRS